jgi:hypothetical protein
LYEAVLHYNQFVRRYCQRTGATLVDLFNAYRPESYRAMPDMFGDPAHPRAELYPALARCTERALASRLPARAGAAPRPHVAATSPGSSQMPRRFFGLGARRHRRPERPVIGAAVDPIRRVRYATRAAIPALQDFAVNYYNNHTSRLIPNTEVWVGDECWLKIDSLGCKGEEIDRAAPTIGIFGDSTVWGGGPDRHKADSWPRHVRVPGYQVLNAGIDDSSVPLMEQGYETLRAAVNMPVVVLGGHWAIVPATEREWRMLFDAFRRDHALAICTLPVALTGECAERGLEALIEGRAAAATRFRPWGTWPATPDETASLFGAVLRYNEFVRSYCAETGAVPIDLFQAYRPGGYDEVPVMFWDPVHARCLLYPALGACASEALAAGMGVARVERAA